MVTTGSCLRGRCSGQGVFGNGGRTGRRGRTSETCESPSVPGCLAGSVSAAEARCAQLLRKHPPVVRDKSVPCVGQVVAGRLAAAQGPLTAGSSSRTRSTSRGTLAPVPAHFVHLQADAAQGSREPEPIAAQLRNPHQSARALPAHGAGAATQPGARCDWMAALGTHLPLRPRHRCAMVRCAAPAQLHSNGRVPPPSAHSRRVVAPAPAVPAPKRRPAGTPVSRVSWRAAKGQVWQPQLQESRTVWPHRQGQYSTQANTGQ